ncbi:MAG: GTPase HflX [Candidatus Caldarchaeum sp.]|nr:GTPase HflX [Candidatus Caldarchaeum sp.]MDW8062705.1 GTPase HflX [Candidatus Caldarchaeum sp.]
MKVALIQRLEDWSEYNLDELEELCKSVGYQPVYKLVQKRPVHSKFMIGPGKLEELRKTVKRMNIEKIVSENELKPVQEYNLAKALSIPVISRTQLILEIFAQRAASTEAKLQIKLAELQYELSRAKEKVRLAKKGEQPGFHGLGAYEADVYYNEVFRRISTIKEKLRAIRLRKTLMRKKRAEGGFPVVALTGYTNAGKTTLFNRLSGESQPVSSQLFTTLSTTSRIVEFKGRKAYLSDTVGFIKNLPHLLVESFHSTLSEFIYADLLLLVVDVSETKDEIETKLNTCLNVLDEVGVRNVPLLIVFNKIDRSHDYRTKIEEIKVEHRYVAVSATTGQNLDELEKVVADMMGGYVRLKALLADRESTYEILSEIRKVCNVLKIEYGDGSFEVDCEAPVQLAEKIKNMAVNFHVV